MSRYVSRCNRGLIILFALIAPCTAQVPMRAWQQPALERGFREMYNLDFKGAHQTFHVYQQLNPDDPLGYVADGAAYLFS